jgi:hypothetical protein|tara:strand:+ start:5884 stop:6891 length:1008 start_codon:yes stop_codon:yes gene_type:complete
MFKFKIPTWLRTLSFIFLASVLIYFAFRSVNLNEVWVHAKKAKWGYIAISFLIGYSAVISRGKRWVLVLESLNKSVSSWHAIHATAFGYLMNQVLPRAGEVARATALNRSDKIPVNILIGTIIIERTIDLLMMGILIGVTFILSSEEIQSFLSITESGVSDNSDSSNSTLKIMILVISLLICLLAFYSKKVKSSLFFLWMKNFVSGMLDGIKSVGKLENKTKFWQHTMFIWVSYFLMVYLCFFAFPFTEDLSVFQGLFVMTAAAIGYLVPVPGGVGAYHYLVAMALVVLGRSYEQGLAFATVVHATQTLMMISTGIVGFFSLTSKKVKSSSNGND